MRIVSIAALIALMAPSHPACAQGFDDADFCYAMREIAKERAPKPNGHTTHIAVNVLCDAKIVDFKMRPGVRIKDLSVGWQERMHVLLNHMYCQGLMREAIDNGWTVAFTITSADGERHYMTADCR